MGFEVHTSVLTATDGVTLATRHYTPADANVRLLLVHGYAEHSERYAPLAELFAGQGIETHLLDLRGHGLSEGTRGHVERFGDYRSDLELFIRAVHTTARPLPATLFGHSLGGLIVLDHVARVKDEFQSIVVSSPFLAPAFDVPRLKKGLAQVVSRVYPTMQFDNQLDPALLTHDPKAVEKYRSDPLIFETTTPRWFMEVSEAQKEVVASAGRIELPALFMLGEDDRVADRREAEAMFANLPNPRNRMRVYEGFYHEVLNEAGRDEAIRDLLDWLAQFRA